MENIFNCPGGCSGKTKIKFNNNKKIDLKDLNLKCTNTNHDKPRLIECETCKLIFSEFINNKFIEKYEDVKDEKYIEEINYKKKYFKNLYQKIKNEINSEGNVLEIGSYYGVFSNIAKQNINNLHSLELSHHAREYAKKFYDINSIGDDPLKYLEKKRDFFHNILMFDVIEHLDEPFNLFKNVEYSLKPDGKFIFTTFDMDTIVPKLLGKNYHWIMPMHKYYFSRKTLQHYLKKNNLEIYKVMNDERTISLDYLNYKLCILFPKLKKLINLFLGYEFLKKKNIIINFRDLKIFYVKKIK